MKNKVGQWCTKKLYRRNKKYTSRWLSNYNGTRKIIKNTRGVCKIRGYSRVFLLTKPFIRVKWKKLIWLRWRASAGNVSNSFYHFSSLPPFLYFLFTFNTGYAESHEHGHVLGGCSPFYAFASCLNVNFIV